MIEIKTREDALEALRAIKAVCERHPACDKCPLYAKKPGKCYSLQINGVPEDWKIPSE